jgi:superfamily I DNA and RNA helicase
MFAHALGMGLFETKKLRWLEDNEWNACGYLVDKSKDGTVYKLKREALRRFEDLQDEKIESVKLFSTNVDRIEKDILDIINSIKSSNPTVLADDIGIIFIDSNNRTYLIADKLEQSVPRYFGWEVNKAYESKRKVKDTLFVSNKNNVKGLEFPFVICITDHISSSYSYRNALYMMITRSFIRTYLISFQDNSEELSKQIDTGLKGINVNNYIEVKAPSEKEKEEIKTTIKFNKSNISYYDFIYSIFTDLKIKTKFKKDLYETTRKIIGEDFDYENAKEVIQFNYKKMLGD